MDVKVNINGTEKNKNEIIYNNIIDTMEDMIMAFVGGLIYCEYLILKLKSL